MTSLAEHIVAALSGAEIDPTSRPSAVVVSQAQWSAAAAAAYEAGATRCEWLTAVHLPIGLQVAALLRCGEDDLLLVTELSGDALPSLCHLWPSLMWHERECAEMFGITFTDHPDLRPLLLAGTDVVAPLRRDFPLRERLQRAWPGGQTATGSTTPASGPAQGRRAVGPPPGVHAAWRRDAHE